MTQIILNDDQAETIRRAVGSVALVDRDGKLLGRISRPFTNEHIAELIRRAESDGPWYTTKQVLDYLATLDRQ
jgi:hypothetical protein